MKKGQSAIEFFVTYGWAIFLLVIVIGILFTSGLLTPNYLISEECGFGSNLACNFALFNEDGSTQMVLEFTNGFPYEIQIRDFELQTRDRLREFSFAGFAPVNVPSGGNATFRGTLSGSVLEEGDVHRFVGNLTYVSCAPEIGPGCSTEEHTLSGSVTGRVIPQ